MLTARGILVMLLVISTVVPVAVAAQSTGNETTAAPAGNQSARIAVSPQLTILDYEYRDGSMLVTVRAEYSQLVAVSDLFGSIPENGGASRQESRQVRVPGGVTELRVDAAPYNGLAVVTISSGGSSVTLAERVDSSMIGGPWGPGDAQAAGLGGLASAFVLITGYGYRKVKGIRSKPERLI